MTEFCSIIENEIIPLVNKPGRYVGNEVNVIKKDWSNVDIKIALIFPDLYEIGMSHVGFEILYHILNKPSFVVAERVYAPAIDMEEKLRERDMPLFSLESRQPLKNFDVLGITLQYELHYTNVINLLDLGGVPIYSKDRGDDIPLVIAGGPCVCNPEPIADFIDAFVLGDGEEIVIEMAELIREVKKQQLSRSDLLYKLSQLRGIYVPSYYQPQYEDEKFVGLVNVTNYVVPEKIEYRIIDQLKPENYPVKPLVPLIETTHDRYSVEIMRGCTQGCRFCNAGFIYRPVRERPVDELEKHVEQVIENTGYDEISLASLSTSDYSQLIPLLHRLSRNLESKKVNVSFPSMRTETFTTEIAKFARKLKKTGITLAPEAGTERLRKVINKTNSNEDLLRAVEIAFSEGWNLIKLYFMIGQPGETKDDLDGIINLVRDVKKIGNQYRGKSINISVSPFCPKPGTPFQWVAQDTIQQMKEKVFYIKDRIPKSGIKFSWRDPEVSFLEGVIARGDRRVGEVIYHAWKAGAKFDAWSDQFKFECWQNAFEQCQIAPENFTRKRELDEIFPWDHISKGVSKKFLKNEYQRAFEEQVTPDCRVTSCNACGLMTHSACQDIIKNKLSEKRVSVPNTPEKQTDTAYGRTPKRIKTVAEPTAQTVRLKYQKGEEIRFTSHLDLIRLFERSFRRSGVKLIYSQGFHPHPRISYSPPLAMGYTSDAEYMDVQCFVERGKNIILSLNRVLPQGLRILAAKTLVGKTPSLTSVIDRAEYEVKLFKSFDQSYLRKKIADFLQREQIVLSRTRGKMAVQQIDIRPFIESIEFDDQQEILKILLNYDQGRTARVQEILSEMLTLSEIEIALSRVNRKNLLIQSDHNMVTPMDV